MLFNECYTACNIYPPTDAYRSLKRIKTGHLYLFNYQYIR